MYSSRNGWVIKTLADLEETLEWKYTYIHVGNAGN